MLDLEQVRFQVDTKSLDDALTKLGSLGTAVENLGKVQQKQSKVVSDASKELAKSSKTKEEAADSVVKSAGKIKKANEDVDSSSDKVEKRLNNLKNTLIDLSTNWTRGESSQLNYFRNLNAGADQFKELEETLKGIRKYLSDPFDNALGPIRSITAELDRLNDRANLVSKGISMTAVQLRQYSIISEQIKTQFTTKGIDFTKGEGLAEYNKLLKETQDEYIGILSGVNKLNKAEQDRLTIARELENAEKSRATALVKVTRETEKLQFATSELAQGLNLGSQNKMFAMRDQLKAAGIEGAALETRLQHIKQLLIARQGKSELSNIARDAREARSQVDHLSRAIGVQLGDVGVSLASGQNPLTVLIQQGDQLRFAIANAKDAGQDLSKSMNNAIKGIATSFIDTGKVMGGFFVSSIKQVGVYIADASIGALGLTKRVAELELAFEAGAAAGNKFDLVFLKLSRTLPALFGVGFVGVITTLVAFSSAFLKTESAISDVTKSIALNSSNYSTNAAELRNLINVLSDGNASFSDASEVMSVAAKEGGIAASSLKMVSDAAVRLRDYGGVAIADTVKVFSEMGKKPVDSLSDLAIKTGKVTQEQIRMVQALYDSGNAAKASAEAMKIAAKIMNEQSATMRENLSALEKITLGWKWALDAVTGAIFRTVEAMMTSKTLAEEWKDVQDKINDTSDPTKLVILRAKEAELIKKIRDQQVKPYEQDQNRKKEEERLALEKARLELYKANTKEMGKQEFISTKMTEMFKGISVVPAPDIKAAVKKFGKEWDDAQKKSSVTNKTDDYIERTTESINNMALALVGATNEEDKLTKAAAELEKIKQDPKFLKIPEQQRKEIEKSWFVELQRQDLLEKQVKIQKYLKDLEKDRLKFNEDLAKLQQEIADATRKNQQGIDEENKKLELRVNLIGLTEEQAKSLTRYYEEQAKIEAITVKYAEQRLGIEKKMQELKKQPGADIAEINRLEADLAKITPQMQAEITAVVRAGTITGLEEAFAQYAKFRDNIADVITTAMYEGGQAGSKKIRDLLVAELKKPIDIIVKATLDSVLGGFGIGKNGADFANSEVGKSFSTGGFISGVKTAFDVLSGSLAKNIGSQFNKFAFSEMGQKLGLVEQGGGNMQLSSLGKGLNTGLQYAGNAVAGYGVYNAVSDGYNTSLPRGLQNTAALVASAIYGPIGGAVAGLINRAFGSKLDDIGLEVGFDAMGGVSGNKVEKFKGGFFKSDYGYGTALETGIKEGIGASIKAASVELAFMADSLDLGTEAITNFTGTFYVSLKDLTADQAAEKIAAEINKIRENMAKAALGTEEYNRFNESSYDTLKRLSTVLSTVNSVFENLGWTLEDVSLKGAVASQSFVDLFGGLEGFASAFSYYYENFYSDAERLNALSNQVKQAFLELEMPLPQTREAFRDMVDAAKAAGNDRLVAGMLKIQQAFAALTPSLEDSRKVLEELIGVRIDLTNTELERYKSLKEAATDLSKFVKDLITGTNSPLSASSKLNRLYGEFTQQLLLAESGNVGAFGTIKDTATSLLEQAKNQSTSALDYARTFYKVTGDLESLSANTEDSSSIMIGLLNQQLLVLQDQLDLLRTASRDVVSDIYSSTLSGLGGTDLSSNVMSASGELRNILQVVNAYSMIGRTGVGLSPNQIDQQGFDSWLSALNTGTLSNSDFMSRFTTEAIANGAAFNTAAGNTDAVTLNEVVVALESLGIQLTDLKATSESTAVFSAKTAKILDAVSQGGTALTTIPA